MWGTIRFAKERGNGQEHVRAHTHTRSLDTHTPPRSWGYPYSLPGLGPCAELVLNKWLLMVT